MTEPALRENATAEEKTDAQLVRQAGTGDRRAFEKLVDRYQTAVFRMVFYRTRSRLDAEDISQEVFMRAFDRLPELKDSGKFRSWLFSIAVNRTRDFLRRQRVLSLFGMTAGEHSGQALDRVRDEGLDPHEKVLRQDFWNRVGTFLDNLSRLEREVFLLRFWDQFRLKEIAEVLGKSESTVKTHLYRALSKLRQSADVKRLLMETGNEY